MLHIPASRIAISLGFVSAAPFIVLALCTWLVAPAWQIRMAEGLLGYGAAVLAFLGGMHWGIAAAGDDAPHEGWRYIYGICPPLLAWVAISSPVDKGLFLLFSGLVAAFIVDRRVLRTGWLVALRGGLTVVAVLSLYAAYKALQH